MEEDGGGGRGHGRPGLRRRPPLLRRSHFQRHFQTKVGLEEEKRPPLLLVQSKPKN